MRRARLLVVCLLLAGCGGATGAAAPGGEPIEVFGPYRGVEADRFMETLRPFIRRTGTPVRYVGSVDFVGDLQQRVGEGGDPPDVALVPQPGLVRRLVDDGRVRATGPAVDAAVQKSYPPATARLGRVGGARHSVPFRITVKSLVWYRPDVFAAHGWKVPRTLDELSALADRIERGSDLAPWCFGMSSGSATGWPATDWVEDIVLRTDGTDVYRRWATGRIGFDDPRIERAFERFRALVLAPGRLEGGVAGAVETPVDRSLEPLLADPPGCAMSKQPDFASSWMPDGTTIGRRGTVAWFVLPADDASEPPPVLVGGDAAVQFRRTPAVDALMAYLAGPQAGASWAAEGGFLSPKSSIPPAQYDEGYRRSLATQLRGAPALGFDASDQMPPDVGSGVLWTAIAEWVAGGIDYDTLARRVDRAERR